MANEASIGGVRGGDENAFAEQWQGKVEYRTRNLNSQR